LTPAGVFAWQGYVPPKRDVDALVAYLAGLTKK
jgi:hypothetical protein